MLNNVHIIGLGLMGTNLGINLVNSGVNVSGYDTNIDSIERAEKLRAVNISPVSYTHLTLPTTERV